MIPQELLDFNDNRLRVVIQNQIKKAVVGESTMFLKGIDLYLDDVPDIRREYAYTYVDTLVQNAEAWGIKNVNRLIENLTVETLAVMHCLDNLVFVGLDTKYPDFKPALYTNNTNILLTLFHNGLLSNTESEMQEILTKMNTRRKTMLRDAKYTAIRLDVGNYSSEGDVQYNLVLANYMELLSGERFIFIPVQAYYDIARFFQSNEAPMRVIYEDYVNKKQREAIITMSANTLKDVLPPELYEKRYEVHESLGFNQVNLKLVAWDLEAPMYKTGIRTFGAETLSKIEIVDKANIDTAMLMVGTELGYMFKEVIMSKSVDELKTFTALDLSSARGRTVYAMLLDFERSSSSKQLYYAMLANPQIFGDLKTQLPVYKEKYKCLLEGEVVQLPYDMEDRRTLLRDLAMRGIVEFQYQNKKGEISNKRMTLLPKALKMTLGFDYVEKYETNVARLKAVYNHIKNFNITNTVTKQKLALRYDIEQVVDVDAYYSLDIEEVLEELQEAIGRQSRETGLLSPTVIRLKSVVAKNKYTFIQAINTEHIQSDVTFYDCAMLDIE